MTQLSVPHLIKTQGNVANISAALSVRPSFAVHQYGVSKTALDHYTRNAAMMYAPVGVRVNAIRVGGVKTPIYAKAKVPALTDAFIKQVELNTLQGRMGEPKEIAEVIAFLANNKKAR